jgi:hypothetical protein
MKRILIAMCLLTMGAPATAAQVLKKLPDQFAADKAYVLVEIMHAKPMMGSKVPGTITLARYDPEGGDVRGGVRSPGTALDKDVPVRLVVNARPLMKGEASRLYLLEMEPDTWVIEGIGNTAFSLGSSSFSLAAGSVIDLGVITPRPDWREGDNPNKAFGRTVGSAMLFGAFVKQGDPTPWMAEQKTRGPGDLPLPDSIAARVRPVQLAGGAKFGNYLGGLVNRMAGRAGRGGGESAPIAPSAPAQ